MPLRRDLTGLIVDVFVGPKRKKYSIHENRLIKCCRFFEEELSNTGLEDSRKTIYLADDDAEVFELFASWLYKGKVTPINANMKYKEGSSGFVKDHVSTIDPYFELYFMAEGRGLVALKNHTMDLLQAYVAEQDFVLSS